MDNWVDNYLLLDHLSFYLFNHVYWHKLRYCWLWKSYNVKQYPTKIKNSISIETSFDIVLPIRVYVVFTINLSPQQTYTIYLFYSKINLYIARTHMFMHAHEKKKLLNMREVVMNVGMIKLFICQLTKRDFHFRLISCSS